MEAAGHMLVGGEHVDVDDPELSYRVTLDFIDAEAELDRYMEALEGNTKAQEGIRWIVLKPWSWEAIPGVHA